MQYSTTGDFTSISPIVENVGNTDSFKLFITGEYKHQTERIQC